MKNWLQAALIQSALLLGSCVPPAGGPVGDQAGTRGGRAAGELVVSDRHRDTSPGVRVPDLAGLVKGNSAFAWDLYQVFRETGGNLFYCPISISLALAMTYAGARGETEQQMAQALHLPLDRDRLHATFNRLDLELARRGRGKGRRGKGFRLSIANGIWGQVGYQFLAQFLDILAEHYGAGLRLLDFAGAPEACRTFINTWVSEQTEGRIENLIPQGIIEQRTRLILTNAVYFCAAWSSPFNVASTEGGRFFLLDGRETIVPMMRQTESLGYAQGEKYQAVEMPYDGWELSMVILLPEMGAFEAFEAGMDANRAEAIVQDLSPKRVALNMPRFRFALGFGLAEALAAMGMSDAFSHDANFSGMTGSRDLFLTDLIHKAFVSVDEEGTEAAAATAVVMVPKMRRVEKPVDVRIDRPFIFFIRDNTTGTILFVGRVVDPNTGPAVLADGTRPFDNCTEQRP